MVRWWSGRGPCAFHQHTHEVPPSPRSRRSCCAPHHDDAHRALQRPPHRLPPRPSYVGCTRLPPRSRRPHASTPTPSPTSSVAKRSLLPTNIHSLCLCAWQIATSAAAPCRAQLGPHGCALHPCEHTRVAVFGHGPWPRQKCSSKCTAPVHRNHHRAAKGVPSVVVDASVGFDICLLGAAERGRMRCIVGEHQPTPNPRQTGHDSRDDPGRQHGYRHGVGRHIHGRRPVRTRASRGTALALAGTRSGRATDHQRSVQGGLQLPRR